MNWGLVTLALRRSMPLGFALFAVLVLWLCAAADWQPASDLISSTVLRRGPLAREGVWTLGLLLLAPRLVFASAETVTRWRAGDVDWLAQAPVSRWNIVFSTWAGHALAGAIAVVAIGLAAEFAARDFEPSWRVVARTEAPRGALVVTKTPLAWSVRVPANLPEGARMRLGITMFAGAASAELSLSAERHASDGSSVRTHVERRITATTALDIEVPRGEGTLDLELVRERDGAIVALDGAGVAWLAPLASATWISVDIALAAWLALSTLCAIALGVGAWLSRWIATAFVTTLAIATWLFDVPEFASALPWLPLPLAIDFAGHGLGFAAVRMLQLCAAIACVIAAGALARANIATWRRAS